jgi:hypothetical protein
MSDFVDTAKAVSPPVLTDNEVGESLTGGLAWLANITLEAARSAVRAYNTSDGVGPAADALDPIASEQGQLTYAAEGTAARIGRLAGIWASAPVRGVESLMLSELAAAGYPGGQILYSWQRPADGGPRNQAGPWWSQFWLTFPNPSFFSLPTWDVIGDNLIVGDDWEIGAPPFIAELGVLVGDDLVVGDSWVIGGDNDHVSTITAIVQRYKPAHWICRRVEFSSGPVIGDDLVIGTNWTIGGTTAFVNITG